MADEARSLEVKPQGPLRKAFDSPGGPLIVLRAFLGVTFLFAGLQKLANPGFFTAGAAGSFDEQLRAAVATSPLHHILDFALHAPTLVALVIALGELAVGLGTLTGCFTRVAAIGGMALSLSFFLTISYSDSPYYYGADIVFLFAWTPLALSQPGAFSLDALIARAATRARREPLEEALIERRALLNRFGAALGLGATAVVIGGATSAIGRKLSDSSESSAASLTTSTANASTSKGASSGAGAAKRVAATSAITIGGALPITNPADGSPAFIVHPDKEEFRAFSAICTHAGCQVGFNQSAEQFDCPCHGSIFDALTGAVVRGPATRPLPSIALRIEDESIYVTD